MSPLNDNQVRRVLVTFGQVDELLDDVERLARAEPAALGRERPDFAPDEARLMLSAVALARSILRLSAAR